MPGDLFSYTTDPARSQIFGFWLDGVPECTVCCVMTAIMNLYCTKGKRGGNCEGDDI